MRYLVLVTVMLASAVAHASPAHCKDELVTGVVRRVEKARIIVAIGADEAPLHAIEQLPRERFKVGATLVAYCLERDGQSTLSRRHVRLVELLFAREVPEIATGTVKIVGTARDPGARTKVGLSSSKPDVDPVAAAVGPSGKRVQAVVVALGGEPIDLVPYDAEVARYVTNALAPADIQRIVIDNERHSMAIVIPDGTLEAVKGKAGVNVRLAAQLTGWRLDIYLARTYAAGEAMAKKQLAAVIKAAGLPTELSAKLFARGWHSPIDLAGAKPAALAKELDLDEASAARLLAAARTAATK